MRPARWIFPTPDSASESRLVRELGINPITARVLVRRGFSDPASAQAFLQPSLDDLHDPLLMAGMEAARERLLRAIAAREPILICGDYDVDGTVSVVVLKKAIEMAGGAADFHVPHRLRDGYGVRPEVVEEAAARGIRLIVTVDTGIRATAVVRAARELGIDVIVTDHHLPEDELPPAIAVLNPNRRDCEYPEKNLCGAGVVFKLVQSLISRLDFDIARRRRVLESFLRMVAIATVADVVPLSGENRIIVKHGLAGLRGARNHGLRALLDIAGFGAARAPSSSEVAFRIAPRINAAGRMASATDVIELFLTEDEARAREIAGRLHELNKDRQDTEADIVRQVLEECARQPIGDGQAALVFCGRDWHRGVVGIVASRLVERFCRPVFVLSEDGERNLAEGSGRSIPDFHLLDALESMSDLFTRFGGHRQAAGLGLPIERVAQFRDRLNEYACARLTPEQFRPTLELDGMVAIDEITDTAINDLMALAPFGMGNPAPVFALLRAESALRPNVMKEKHVRAFLRQNGRTVSATGWNLGERAGEMAQGSTLDAAIAFEQDQFARSQGWGEWGIVLKDVRPACAAATPGATR
ncbi:MAG TPA: single-stranded-DNA-specific exonuclease RecJ [Bryobacteraceae bacterium]|nr:single-stranded-DNA-specific exonuclease RecJ [Bryobacteraceae bacterium]